jgi:hypothetical protein
MNLLHPRDELHRLVVSSSEVGAGCTGDPRRRRGRLGRAGVADGNRLLPARRATLYAHLHGLQMVPCEAAV